MQLRGIWNGLQSRLIMTRRTIGFILEIHLLLCPCGLLSHPCTSVSGSKVTETARVLAGTEAQRCYRMREHCPRESVAARVLTVVEMLPSEFNSSKVTETARVPARIEAWRCYRRWEHCPIESKAAQLVTMKIIQHTSNKITARCRVLPLLEGLNQGKSVSPLSPSRISPTCPSEQKPNSTIHV